MDEEDIADAEDAKQVQSNEAFSGLGSAVKEGEQHDSFMDVLRTTGETMGIKLLKKMGWREGQGVGPKIRRKARLNEDVGMEGEAAEATHLFAPENSKMISFTRKNDRKGLGYESERSHSEVKYLANDLDRQSSPIETSSTRTGLGALNNGNKVKSKRSSNQGGFGVGILNDNGSDDENAYEMGPKISYNRTVGRDKKKKKKTDLSRPLVNPLLNSKPVFISKKVGEAKGGSTFRRCHDGRLPLDGFVLSSDMNPLASILQQDGKYPPPTIPPDWKSSKTASDPTQPTTGQTPYRPSATIAAASKLSPKSRAALLGETTLPGKSVFDFLTPNARTRIVTATNNTRLPPALAEAPAHIPSHPRTLHSLVPSLSREIAATALGRGTAGWMPYSEDAAKRARYRTFLEVRAGLHPEGKLPERAPDISNDDWVTEMNEFAHAAQIFKPMTGMMATRFTSSSSAPNVTSDNMKPEGAAEIVGDIPLLTRPVDKEKTPAEAAAAVGMYGPLTRSVENFYPTRLLCKRFNIKPPSHVQVDPGDVPPGPDTGQNGAAVPTPQTHSTVLPQKRLELVGKKDMDDLRMSGGGMKVTTHDTILEYIDRSVDEKVQDQGKEETPLIDPERNEALEKERPGEAVFKAIFGSDSEDD